ncbi:MAG: 5-dehydro-4-deoxy-D-glucuronate isomerase [Erysipelotrichaceae bacterium]|nr:5-dehydro-4-deoxy-D-glucuronate isomerase [Erysipelotrichaceae bacterium]
MELRTACSPQDAKHYDTDRMRKEFLIQDLFSVNKVKYVYSHVDRIIIGGCVPVGETLEIEAGDELRADYFLQRREMGIFNIGGLGKVIVDGKEYELRYKDAIYIGRGSKEIKLESVDPEKPARFYFNSCPAHKEYPTVLIHPEDVFTRELGSAEYSNHRFLRRYILPGQVESCQLVMGMTTLCEGSVWNTMPCHTHDRRMEVYLYFELNEDDVVFHLWGEPNETRHIVMRNEEAVISPSWSIHSASATKNYTFIWGMCGENQDFDDMDDVAMTDIR